MTDTYTPPQCRKAIRRALANGIPPDTIDAALGRALGDGLSSSVLERFLALPGWRERHPLLFSTLVVCFALLISALGGLFGS